MPRLGESELVTRPVELAIEVAHLFEQLGIPYYLAGSLASSIHGEPRATRDIDFVAEIGAAQVEPFCRALGGAYYGGAAPLAGHRRGGGCAQGGERRGHGPGQARLVPARWRRCWSRPSPKPATDGRAAQSDADYAVARFVPLSR
jgi:hypothetical protein